LTGQAWTGYNYVTASSQRSTQVNELENQIEAARSALREAMESQTFYRGRPTKAQVIFGLRDEIAKMRSAGWSWDSIAKSLRGTVGATAETIRLVYDGKSKKVTELVQGSSTT
jgi:type II secretory pathway component PulJ